MKRVTFSIFLFFVFFAGATALQMVNSQNMCLEIVPNPLGGWQNPDDALARKFGYSTPIYPFAVSNGYVRYWLYPIWTNNFNGTSSMRYYDLSDSQVASNQAAAVIAAAVAASNAAITYAIAWTNNMTNSWMQSYHVTAAHTFKILGAKYLPGWPTNTSWTYNSAMNAFMAMPAGSQTITQLWDNVFWQRSYVALSDFFSVFCPSTNASDPSDYNIKLFPQLWDMPGVK